MMSNDSSTEEETEAIDIQVSNLQEWDYNINSFFTDIRGLKKEVIDFLKQNFNQGTFKAIVALATETEQELIISTIMFIVDDENKEIAIAFSHTFDGYRRKGAFRMLWQKLRKDYPSYSVHIKVVRHSCWHVFWEHVGFKPTTETFSLADPTEDCSWPFWTKEITDTVLLVFSKEANELSEGITKTKEWLKKSRASEAGLMLSTKVNGTSLPTDESLLVDEHTLSEIRNRISGLIVEDFQCFVEVVGEEFKDWLDFQLQKIFFAIQSNRDPKEQQLQELKQLEQWVVKGSKSHTEWKTVERDIINKWLVKMSTAPTSPAKYTCHDLMLLNSVSSTTGIMFVPIGIVEGELHRLVPAGDQVNSVVQFFIFAEDLKKEPKLLFLQSLADMT